MCLVSAQSALDRQIAAIGDQEFPLEWTFQEGGIRIIVLSYHREDMYLSTASIALRGLVRVMNLYAELGTKAVNTMIYESEVISGRIEISRSGSSIDGIAPSISTGTLFQSVSKKAYVSLAFLSICRKELIPSDLGWIPLITASLTPLSLYPSKGWPHMAHRYRRTL